MPRHRPYRHFTFHAALLACGLLAPLLVSCGLGHGDVTHIRFWNGFTGPDGRTMLGIVREFNGQNPDVRVTMQRLDWATYYNKLFVAGLGNRAPEVFIVHAGNLERFTYAQFVRPLDDLLAATPDLGPADFYPNILAAAQRNGRTMGIPLDVHMMGMYTNNDLLRRAGITGPDGAPKPPATRDEFMDALARISRLEADGGPGRNWGFVFTWFRTNVMTLMYQWGGRPFNEDYSRCTLDSPENIAALQFCVNIIRKHEFAPPPENFDAWIGFRQGRVGIAFEGIWMINDLHKQTDLDWSGGPLPTIGKHPAVWADSHTLCMRSGLEGRRLEAAWRFIKYLSDNSLDWATAGQIPVRPALRESDEFAAMETQAAYARQIPIVVYPPRVPFVFEFYTEFDAAVESALRGSLTPEQAMRQVTDNVNAILDRYERIAREREAP